MAFEQTFLDLLLPKTPRKTIAVPGFEYHPRFLTTLQQIELLRRLDEGAWEWDHQRRSQFYQRPFPQCMQELIGRLMAARLIEGLPANASVMEYAPGVGIGHHVDRGDLEQITIISLGHEYEMDLRHGLGASQHQFMLELGSVLILKGEARWEWEHGIRSRLSDYGEPRERRVSLTFRNAKGLA